MIICPRCGKENQNHYKFCLGCGYELPSDAARHAKDFSVRDSLLEGKAKDAAATSASVTQATVSSAGVTVDLKPVRPGDAPTVAGSRAKRRMSAASKVRGTPDAEETDAEEIGQRKKAALPAANMVASPGIDGDLMQCPQCSSSMPRSFKFCHVCGLALAPATAIKPQVELERHTAKPNLEAKEVRGQLAFLRSDGTAGESYPLCGGQTLLGRDLGGMFARDFYLSPQHARFEFHGPRLLVFDQNSLNGIYLRMEAHVAVPLNDGTFLRVGQQLLRFDVRKKKQPLAADSHHVEPLASPETHAVGRISLVIGEGELGNGYSILPEGVLFGRENGDILFPEDGYVSALHCRIYAEDGVVMLMDLGSSNGTFLRVDQQQEIKNGAILLLGQQLCRVEY